MQTGRGLCSRQGMRLENEWSQNYLSPTRFGECVRSLPWRQSMVLPGGVCCCLGCTSPVLIPNNQAWNHWCFYANIVSVKTSNGTWGPRVASPDELNITVPVKTSHLSLIRCDFYTRPSCQTQHNVNISGSAGATPGGKSWREEPQSSFPCQLHPPKQQPPCLQWEKKPKSFHVLGQPNGLFNICVTSCNQEKQQGCSITPRRWGWMDSHGSGSCSSASASPKEAARTALVWTCQASDPRSW